MSEWATAKQIECGRRIAEEGLDVLDCLQRMSLELPVLSELPVSASSYADAVEVQRRTIETFCKELLPRIVNLCYSTPEHMWASQPPGPHVYWKEVNLVLRTIQRACPASTIYPFGPRLEDVGVQRNPYTTAHEAAIRWAAHDFANLYPLDPSKSGVEYAELLRDETERYKFEYLIELCQVSEGIVDELHRRVINEWRTALDFIHSLDANPVVPTAAVEEVEERMPKKANVIRVVKLLREGLSTDDICQRTSESADNVRSIRSRYSHLLKT